MPKVLTQAQVDTFQRDGCLSPVRAMSAERAQHYREKFEALEARVPDIKKMKTKSHLLTPWVLEIAEDPHILDIFEMVSGLRMIHAYVRPGGVAQDVPDEAIVKIREFLKMMPERLKEYEDLLSGQPIWIERTKNVAVLDVTACLALGVTGPVLR